MEPPVNKHKIKADYFADFAFFGTYDDENTYNHTANVITEFNFNKLQINLSNRFHYFNERQGSEDTNRIKRTQDYFNAMGILELNKMIASLIYNYQLENYSSTDAVGSRTRGADSSG